MWIKQLLLSIGALSTKSFSSQKLLLLECKIHGSHYYSCLNMVKQNQLIKHQALTLKREADNAHDSCAIEIYAISGEKLGYIPKKDNQVIANLIDQKVKIEALISSVDADAWDPVEIKVFFVFQKKS